MTPLELTRKEWENITVSAPKTHFRFRKPITHEFRKYGQALAWLDFDGGYIEIVKLETLEAGRGGANQAT